MKTPIFLTRYTGYEELFVLCDTLDCEPNEESVRKNAIKQISSEDIQLSSIENADDDVITIRFFANDKWIHVEIPASEFPEPEE